MSAWRRKAVEYLPRYKEIIEHADTVSELWSDLWWEFEGAYKKEPKDETVIVGVYAFAIWCWHGSDVKGNNIHLITDVFVQFFERLPQDPVRRQDMPRWLCLQEFEVLQVGPFGYLLGPDEHAQMVKDFRRAKEKRPERNLVRCSKLRLTLPK